MRCCINKTVSISSDPFCFFPELAIPAAIGNGISVAGFVAWLGDEITSEECKTLIFTEYKGAWKDKAKVEFLHRRVE